MEETWEIPRPTAPSASRAPKERVNAATVAYVLRLRAELDEERARVQRRAVDVARLEGELAASDKVEAAAQRYADRLEEKLEVSRRREATLAREVGRLEARAQRAENLLEAPPTRRGWLARLGVGRGR